MAVKLDLPSAWKRVPYSAELVFIGPDWSGQTMRMEIRNEPGDTGAPIVGLDDVSSGEGLTPTYDPAFDVNVTGSEPFTAPATRVQIRINESTLEAISLSTPASKPLDAFYDIHVGAGAAKRLIAHGEFTIPPGVTL